MGVYSLWIRFQIRLTNPVSCWCRNRLIARTQCPSNQSHKDSRMPFISFHSEHMLIAAEITLLHSLTFWPPFIEFVQHSLIQSTLQLRPLTSSRRVIYLGCTISVLTSALQMTLYPRAGGLVLMKIGYVLNSMCWHQAIALGWTMTEHSEWMPVKAPPSDNVLILAGNIDKLYSG